MTQSRLQPRPAQRPGLRARLVVALVVLFPFAAAAGCAGPDSAAPPSVGSVPEGLDGSGGMHGSAYGVSATQWAARVTQCDGVRSLTRSAAVSAAPAIAHVSGALGSAASLASCSVEDHSVLILAFSNRRAQQVSEVSLQRVESSFAVGHGWVALAAQPDSPQEELSIVQGVALTLGGTLLRRVESGSAGAGSP